MMANLGFFIYQILLRFCFVDDKPERSIKSRLQVKILIVSIAGSFEQEVCHAFG